VPPSPEKLKTIKDLIAGVTGFSETRGDQLIVETLPFESALDTDPGLFAPASTTKPSAGPPWLDFIEKYQSALMIAVALIAVLGFLLRVALAMSRGAKRSGTPEVQRELPSPDYEPQPGQSPGQVSSSSAAPLTGRMSAPAGLMASDEEAAGRIRTLAQNDPDVAANVLRMWLQNQKA
jgi:flagellar biosynthesis/type III secretory pathway M-ring protein FliF/YscJ